MDAGFPEGVVILSPVMAKPLALAFGSHSDVDKIVSRCLQRVYDEAFNVG